MFGYIKPDQKELRVRELEVYKAAYCGLCHSMRHTCSNAFCGTLSYDFAFLAVIRMAVTNTIPKIEKKRCIAHPFRKRNAIADNDQLKYCSAAAAILGYGKCVDDISDEKGFIRFRAKLAKPFFAAARKKALKKMPELLELDRIVSEKLSELAEFEKSNEASCDRPAEIFGEIMGEILSFGLEGAAKRLCRAFGKATGHWLYLIDAADDYESDKEKGRFNPYFAVYGDSEGFSDSRKENLQLALKAKLMEAENSLDLIDLGGCLEFAEIIRNTLYLGMPAEAKRILCK